MPTINWIGKDKIVNHHLDIPYHTLDLQYTFDAADRFDNFQKVVKSSPLERVFSDSWSLVPFSQTSF